jgi:octaprenyl-diphosphate synthase
MVANGRRELDTIAECVSRELDLFEKSYIEEFQRADSVLLPVLQYIGKEKGKRIRPILFFLCQGLIGSPNPNSHKVAVLLELLHTATLIHDDVVDQSVTRRGKDTLNALWGDHVSVLMGDYLLAKVLAMGVAVPWKAVVAVISRVVMGMGREELRQALEDTRDRITVTKYLRNIQGKTAGFISASCELGGIVMDAQPAQIGSLRRFGSAFGMAFQIRDDILDISGDEAELGKPVGQDTVNGKITLPLIYALEKSSLEEKGDVLQRLSGNEADQKTWIRDFILEKEGIQYAHEKAEVFSRKAIGILESFPPSPYRESLIKMVEHDLERVG